jgi:hypothetical protein
MSSAGGQSTLLPPSSSVAAAASATSSSPTSSSKSAPSKSSVFFWRKWLDATCVGTCAFGLLFVVWPSGTRNFFSTLVYGDPAAITSWGPSQTSYVQLAHAVLGSVMIGWGTSNMLTLRFLYDRRDKDARQESQDRKAALTIIAASISAWALPDTVYSLASGFWPNAVLNSIFIIGYGMPLVALWNAEA